MACTHVENCPLFPLLSASLPDWIAAYCEGERDGADCARYQLARTGQAVPITLLPNGRSAHAFASRAVPEPPEPVLTMPQPRMRPMMRDRWWVRVLRWLSAPA